MLSKHLYSYQAHKQNETSLGGFPNPTGYTSNSNRFAGRLQITRNGIIVYFYQKKKQAYKLLYLQARLNSMKNLENIKDETQQMILRDFEVGKKIALLKQQSRRENCHKILHELDKLDITKSNELISTDWEKFYQHIDITFDHFHEKLALQYSCLNEKEIQLCCMLKAGFKTNEIAAIWTQSIYSVHKYKTSVRKKIEMPSGADIIDFLNSKL